MNSMPAASSNQCPDQNEKPKPKAKRWKDLPTRTKYSHVKQVYDFLLDFPTDLVLDAVIKLLKNSKKSTNKALHHVLKQATSKPRGPIEVLAKINSKAPKVIPLSPFQGLALLLDANLSKRQYQKVREAATACGLSVLPTYDSVREAKKDCRPPIEHASITETSASYSLQSLVAFTTTRIVNMQTNVIIQSQVKKGVNSENCVITFSCGMDGSSGHRNYKQKYSENENANAHKDSSIFATTMIPLRLHSTSQDVYWNNRTPQSVRFCRPIKIQFAKESNQLIMDEKKSLEDQINNLKPLDLNLGNGHSLKVAFKFYLSIIDGKVLSAFTGTRSTQSCPICKATPNDFNKKENLGTEKFKPKEGTLMYGISPLHCYIRAMEWMIHLAYKLGIQKWQARSKQEKEIVKARKLEIQESLWREMGLRVDFPNACGGGTSNDGNTARRAFQDYEQFSEILGVKVEILQMLRNVLVSLNFQLPLNPEKFKLYCNQLYLKYLKDYSWYKLPASIHKVLVHGCEIISSSSLPLGMLGEEGAEARNKLYKSDRNLHARKSSRTNTMFDVYFRAIDSSDPILSSLSLNSRINSKSKREALPFDVVQLLQVPKFAGLNKNENVDFECFDPGVASILDEIILQNEDDLVD